MIVRVGSAAARGVVRVPASKSIAHRYLICAALARGETNIRNLPVNDDVMLTKECLRRLAAGQRTLDCGESGSTLRFLLPLCLDGVQTRFTGSPRLMERPLDVYEALCKDRGIAWNRAGNTLTVEGKLRADVFAVPGNISSQFISGLLFAMTQTEGKSAVRFTTEAESASYVRLTVDALRKFGFGVSDGLEIAGPQRGLCPPSVTVPADESAAAFFGGLNALGGKVTLQGDFDDLQGDRVWRQAMQALREGTPTLDVADCPDLAPIYMAVAACLHGCRLIRTKRLRLKESDRGAAMAQELQNCGVPVTVFEDEILVGCGLRTPTCPIESHNDHRIAMAMAVALTTVGGEIRGAEAVSKSFPDFWRALSALGVPVRYEKSEACLDRPVEGH